MIVVVIYIFLIILFGCLKKVNCFDSFKEGVFSSFKILLDIFPNILGLTILVQVVINCGLIELINEYVKNFYLPIEIFIQMLLKPISSSSSMIMMLEIFNKFGTNSFLGILSSIIQGCSDTTLYIVTLYFSSVHIKQYKYALKVGLLTDILTFIIVLFIYFLIFH